MVGVERDGDTPQGTLIQLQGFGPVSGRVRSRDTSVPTRTVRGGVERLQPLPSDPLRLTTQVGVVPVDGGP